MIVACETERTLGFKPSALARAVVTAVELRADASAAWASLADPCCWNVIVAVVAVDIGVATVTLFPGKALDKELVRALVRADAAVEPIVSVAFAAGEMTMMKVTA